MIFAIKGPGVFDFISSQAGVDLPLLAHDNQTDFSGTTAL
jgi:hypothetical protein